MYISVLLCLFQPLDLRNLKEAFSFAVVFFVRLSVLITTGPGKGRAQGQPDFGMLRGNSAMNDERECNDTAYITYDAAGDER